MLISAFMQTGFCAETTLSPENVPRITKEQLNAQLGNPDLVILDVRSPHDWEESNIMIKGAVREDPHKLGSWIDKYPKDKTFVLY